MFHDSVIDYQFVIIRMETVTSHENINMALNLNTSIAFIVGMDAMICEKQK